VAAPLSDAVAATTTFGRVGGQWGLATGVTLEGTEGKVGGGEPVARASSGRVFALVSTRPVAAGGTPSARDLINARQQLLTAAIFST